jgi:hypothetical protein
MTASRRNGNVRKIPRNPNDAAIRGGLAFHEQTHGRLIGPSVGSFAPNWPKPFTDQGQCIAYVNDRPTITLFVPADPL